MIIQGVEFPEQLFLAQRNGNLVIFAGAGVSLDRPSSLPTFVELTEQVISRKLKAREKDQLDRILGTYNQLGVNVHRIAREIIEREGSRPTLLHGHLLNLFSDLSSVRVVTTNFDRHFSTSAKKLFSESPEEYYAPALPLGNDFRGIVYLHGSLERVENRFVLTDSDFGRAYLTEGWATRFLWSLFRQFTVLFVGYSHNDPVMHYLSKGLPSETNGKRYALTPDDDVERWNSLQIIPISYPVTRKRHKAMTTAVGAWAKLSAMGALDYEHRIKVIVEGSTYLTDEDSSFLLYVIKYTNYAKFFAKYATRLEWLLWAETNDLLKPLFWADRPIEDYFGILAEWIADKYLIKETDALLSLIQRQGQILNPLLWNMLARELHVAKPRPKASTINRIISTLLKSTHSFNHIDHLNYLLMECGSPEHATAALLLFEYLTTPHVNLQRSYALEGDERTHAPSMEIDTPGDDHWLREAYKKIFEPNMAKFASKLEIIASAQLLKADLLLKSYRGPEAFDSISFRRSAIESHEQDRFPGRVDVIIDAARDSIEYLLKNEPNSAVQLIHRWFDSHPEIMKRIAIHALAESTTIPADSKIQWLLDRKLLFDTGCVHEVFRVLKLVYPQANEETKVNLLKSINKGFMGKRAEVLEEKTNTYEIYNLLYWINSSDPSCILAKEAFLKIQEANPECHPREHPDFHHWSGGARFIGHESPVTVEELVAKEPVEQLEFLLTYQGSFFDGPDRDGLLNTITQAVQQHFNWGYSLSKALVDAGMWDSDIWNHIFRGWEEGLDNEGNLVIALTLVVYNSQLFKHDYHISSLIQKRFNEKYEASDASISLAEQLAEQLMDHVELIQQQEQEDSNDWLTTAINHSGGKLAEFWVHILSRTRQKAGDSWAGLPEVPRRCLEKMISGTSFGSQLSRVFIASQLHFMFYMDWSWTIRHVLPLLDWSEPLRARQCWDGYLFWGRYGENTLPHLMPFYRRAFRELHTLRDEQRRRFCEHLASIAIYSSINPLEDGWLAEFIESVENSDRINFAQQFGQIIRGLDDEATKLMWEQWLGKYWHRRNLGQPVPLSPSELAEMVEWSAGLGSVFDKVVKLICDLHAPNISDSYMFHLMNEKNFAQKYTKDLAKLLIHLIPQMTESWACHELVPLAKALCDAGLDSRSFSRIQTALVEIGCNETI